MLSERVHKLFIYTVTTLMLFYILKNSDFLHVYLQGNKPNPNYFNNYPCTKLPNYLDDFYVMKLAYHGYEMVYTLLFQRHRRDFPEYILHHTVTLFLISFSYSLNFLNIGAVIMLLHDYSDIILSIFKLTVDTTSAIVQYIAYAIMLSNWIFTRHYFFVVWIIKAYYD